jgi:hypothetical protein
MFRRSDQVNQCGDLLGAKRLSVSHGVGAIVQRQIVKKQKAASEGKGRIRGFGGPKKGSVVKSPKDRVVGGWRLRIEKGRGRRSLWGRASEGSCQRISGWCGWPCLCCTLKGPPSELRSGRATLVRLQIMRLPYPVRRNQGPSL